MECPLFLVWPADISRNQRLGNVADVTMEAMSYLETFFVAGVDAALAARNAVISAESLGLSTVRIGALRWRLRAIRTTWTDRVFSRIIKLAHRAGRDRLREALNALGFGLR